MSQHKVTEERDLGHWFATNERGLFGGIFPQTPVDWNPKSRRGYTVNLMSRDERLFPEARKRVDTLRRAKKHLSKWVNQ